MASGSPETRDTALRRQQLQPLANGVLGLAEALERGAGVTTAQCRLLTPSGSEITKTLVHPALPQLAAAAGELILSTRLQARRSRDRVSCPATGRRLPNRLARRRCGRYLR